MAVSKQHEPLRPFIQEPEAEHIIFEEEVAGFEESESIFLEQQKEISAKNETQRVKSAPKVFLKSNEIASARFGTGKGRNYANSVDYRCHVMLSVNPFGEVTTPLPEKKSQESTREVSKEKYPLMEKNIPPTQETDQKAEIENPPLISSVQEEISESDANVKEFKEHFTQELEKEQLLENSKSIPVKESAGVEDKSLIFLEGGIGVEEEKPRVYSLQEEFDKKRKNKSWLFYFVILLFMGTLAFATYFLKQDIERRSKVIKMDFTEFADLNLSDLLDTARKAEERINKLRSELEYSKLALADAIRKIRQDADQEIASLDGKNLSRAQKNAEIKRIRTEMEAKIAALKNRYQSDILAKQEEINQARVQKEAYDKKLKSQMADYEEKMKIKMGEYERSMQADRNRTQELLAERKKVHDLEIQNLKADYERELAVLRSRSQTADKNLEERLTKQMNTLESQYQSQVRALEEKLQEKGTQQTGQEQQLGTLQEKIKELEGLNHSLTKMSEQYRYAFSYFAAKTREHGYILDARDSKFILAELSSFYDVKAGTSAYIINDQNKKVAQVKLFPEKNQVRVEVVSTVEGENIEPFDKIVIEFQ